MRHHTSTFIGFFGRAWQATRLSTVSVLLASLFLAACGGGSDDYSSTDNDVSGAPTLTSVSILEDEGDAAVSVGDVVTVVISASEAIMAPTVMIGGSVATPEGSGDSWTASRVMTADDTQGEITLSVAYSDIGGTDGVTVMATTDDTAVQFDITYLEGNAIDGPFQFAKAFGDYNGNGLHDEGEPSDLTDATGAYALADSADAPAEYTVIVEMTADTIDAISGESYADTGVVLKGSSTGSVVTPLTTILEAAKVADPAFTAADLATAMGLPAGVDIATFNPFAAGADAATAHAVETVFQQVMTATLLVAEAMQGVAAIAGAELTPEQASAAAVSALTKMVVVTADVDLADAAQIGSLQVLVKAELALNSIVVDDAIADFVLDATSATVTTVAAAFDTLTVDDFIAGDTSAVSIVKQEAAAEIAAVAALTVAYLSDFPDATDLTDLDTSDVLTLDTEAGVNAAVVDNGGDTGSAISIEITEAFNGTTIGEGSVYTFPASAESYAGFANMNTAIYPITLAEDSVITFTGSVPSGASADVRFRFEANPYPATEPSFDTAAVTVTGTDSATYSIAVPAQGANTFNSLIMYLNTRDVGVVITDIVLSGGGDTGGGDTGGGDTGGTDPEPSTGIEITEAFDGTTIGEGSVYTYPATAADWAGFANMNTAIYPITVAEDSVITFTGSVPSGASADVRFRFEANPYPATEPSFDTAAVTVTGTDSATYSIAVPAQGANTFSSLIMYLNTRDVGVVITDITLSGTGGDTGGGDTGGGDTGGGDSGGDDEVYTLVAGDYIDFNDAEEQGEVVFTDFGGTFTQFTQDPTDATKTVAVTSKSSVAEEWAGTTVSNGPVIFPLTATATTASVRVYSPAAGMVVRLKLEVSDNPDHTVETDALTTAVGAWETLTFDFSNEATNNGQPTAALNTDYVFGKLSIFFNKGVSGADAGEVTFYWDSLTWVGEGDSTGGGDTGGGTDPEPATGIQITEAFDGTTIGEGSVYTYPATAADWAGFANMNTAIYPITVAEDSVITFTGSVPSGESADVRFRFEANPYPATEPSFDTVAVTVTGSDSATYSIAVPSQGANTFNSLVMYLNTRDVGVAITDIAISAADGDTGSGDTGAGDTGAGDTGAGDTGGGDTDPEPLAGIEITEAFDGTTIGEGSVYTYPASAADWAGFANMNTDIYPITLPEDTVITFTGSVPSGASADVRFRFEANPYPATEPSFNTAAVTVTGTDSATYSIAVPSQGTNTFNSLVMYLNTRDVGVVITDITIPGAGSGTDSGTGTDTGTDTGNVATGELITNGTFENADLAGWALDGAGSSTVVNTEASGGNFSANLLVGEIQDAIIKAANLAAGELTMGQSVTVSFDLKAEYSGAGGVIFAQFFHESAIAGSTNGDGGLGNGLAPLAATSEWQTFSYSDTLDTDVSGGVSLLLKASCGAVAGCGVDAYVDNVSVVVTLDSDI